MNSALWPQYKASMGSIQGTLEGYRDSRERPELLMVGGHAHGRPVEPR